MELHAELDDDEAGPPDGALDGASDDGGAADGPAAGATVPTTTHRT
jgi:hypothetical protein